MAASWNAFLLASLAATASPGPGVMTAISTAATAGPRRAIFSSSGNATGIVLVAALAMSGAGLLMRSSPTAFGLLKLAGAAYLAWLGARQWLGAGNAFAASPAASAASVDTPAAAYRRGLLVALSNPKSLVFFSAVFPHFMGDAGPARFLLLVATFVTCSLISHGFYVGLTACAGPAVLGAAGMRVLARASGVVLIAMGCALPFAG